MAACVHIMYRDAHSVDGGDGGSGQDHRAATFVWSASATKMHSLACI